MFSSLLKKGSSSLSSSTRSTEKKRPSVYEESVSMLAGALIIYFFADLRDMAREGEISSSLDDLSPPLTADKVLAAVEGNEEALAKRAISHDDLKQRLEALKMLKEHQGGLFRQLFSSNTKAKTTMTHFVDTKADEEIVHAIVVNGAQKRISVIFRGSVTQKDFVQDAKCAQKKIDNPVASLVEKEELKAEDIRIHTGFHQYLFHLNKETGKTRLQEILDDVVESLRSNPGFDLYSSGHSLGGALCTLFGFFAAANDELMSLLDGPVRVYSIASPYVGNWKFKMAFQELERKKRLQHLRIANMEDMVTLLPFATPKLSALSPMLTLVNGAGNLYKHTGIRLQLTAEPSKDTNANYSISYPKEHEADDEEYAKEVKDSMNAGKSLAQAFYYLIKKDFERVVQYHSCEEYEERLEKCKSVLDGVTLDDLYADKAIVGGILDEDYEPKKRESGMKRASKMFGYMRGSKKSDSIESK